MMTTYIVFLISLWIYGCRSQCAKENPFYMIDKGCANFNDVCVKKDSEPCKSLLQACTQCPASNLTESTLVNMLTILRDQRSKSTNEFKNIENSSFAIIILIVISFVVILLLLIEMRFQIFKRCCRKRENGRKDTKNGDEIQPLIQEYQTSPTMQISSGARAPAEQDAQTNNSNLRLDETISQTLAKIIVQNQTITKIVSDDTFDEKFNQKLENIQNEIKTITKTLSGAAAPSKQINGDSLANNSITKSIHMGGYLIEIQINQDDNAVKIKQKICAKMPHTKSYDFKTMVLKLKGTALDDNQYLADKIRSVEDSLHCDVIENLEPNEIVVVMLRGNTCLPEMIQFKKSQTIEGLKSVLSQLTGVPAESLKLFRDLSEVDKLDDLDDYESLRVIERHTGQIKIESIFDNIEEVTLSYSNVDSVGSIKKKIADLLDSPADDIILLCDIKNLNDNVFVFEIDIKQLKFCHLISATKLDNIKYMMHGNISEIFEGRNPWTKKKVVLKKYQLKTMKILKENKAFLNELLTFQITKSHGGFVHLNGVFKEKDYFYISMEKMEGSIKDYIQMNHPLSEKIIVKWAKQILLALKYLHDHLIIHRNIKPSNILLDKDGNIKLSSFGVAKYAPLGDKKYLMEGFQQSGLGTFRYMAPEVCNNENYGAQVDVWSFGAIMIEMATGIQPFDGKTQPKALMEIREKKQIPFQLDRTRSPEIQDFINKCLIPDPNFRATVDELLNHDFLRPK